MQNNANLPKGFITVEDAVELIKKSTRKVPVVDMDYIRDSYNWIETGKNFRIPLIRMLTEEEYIEASKRPNRTGRVPDTEHTGDANVYVATNYEKELLKKTIDDKYQELTGHEYRKANVRGVSTVADDAQGRSAVRPHKNKPNLEDGGSIIGTHGVSNGEGLNV